MAKRMDSLEEKFLNTIKENNLIEAGDVIVVGVSGGPDSITLLTCLNKYKKQLGCKLVVAHINHLIREDSTEDEQFVENVCKKMDIPFYVKRAKVEEIAKANKKGTEEVGREIRYSFFDEIAENENANKIAIAHNMNDNAETIILNLLRGTGAKGLEGIQPSEYGKYIRPLINCERIEIEKYCDSNKLMPRIDSTNKENVYKRNIIRNKILPELKELNPNIVQTLSRTSKIIKDENSFVEEETEKTYNQIVHNSVGKTEIATKEFNGLSKTIKSNLILKIIEKHCGTARNIEKRNIDDIIEMSGREVGNKHIELNKKIKIEIKNKKIIFTLL